MAISAQHRRRASLGYIVQLHTELASWNENNPYGAKIQMSFNFDEDLAEMQHPTNTLKDQSRLSPSAIVQQQPSWQSQIASFC